MILPVVPCNEDIDLSTCLTLAKKHDPDGERTFVILTKVDLIDKGGESDWVEVLKSGYSKCPNIMGYAMIKNRSQKDLNDKISIKKAHEQELAFFNKTRPWCNLKSYMDMFGIVNLAKRLVKIQVSQIKKCVPM
eukprot:UN29577